MLLNDIVSLPSGHTYIAGQFETVNGLSRQNIVRLYANGTVDLDFTGSQANGALEEVVVLPDGKVMVGGHFTSINGVPRVGIAHLNIDGSLDPSFSASLIGNGLQGDMYAETISRQPDGKFIIGGAFAVTGGGPTHINLIRLNADGSHDPSFTLSAEDRQTRIVVSTAVQPDGKVLVGGTIRR